MWESPAQSLYLHKTIKCNRIVLITLSVAKSLHNNLSQQNTALNNALIITLETQSLTLTNQIKKGRTVLSGLLNTASGRYLQWPSSIRTFLFKPIMWLIWGSDSTHPSFLFANHSHSVIVQELCLLKQVNSYQGFIQIQISCYKTRIQECRYFISIGQIFLM